jgi:hypothetical protein
MRGLLPIAAGALAMLSSTVSLAQTAPAAQYSVDDVVRTFGE